MPRPIPAVSPQPPRTRPARLLALALWAGALGPAAALACSLPAASAPAASAMALAGDPAAPEPASGYRPGLTATHARSHMVVAAHPLAAQAGCEVLRQGGSAVDAAVAVQAVLGLVEPQSSGLGGGGFMIHYDAASGRVQAYDGRETAPARATAHYLRWVSETDRRAPQPGGARASGRSIGTPGLVRLLALAHQDHGRRPWGELFQPAIALATEGFPIGARLATAIASAAPQLLRDDEATAYFFNADRSPKPQGARLQNPAYAATLDTLARQGADAFYRGPIAEGIVRKIQARSGGQPAVVITPGWTQLSDLARYQARRREAVCAPYRSYWVCGLPPPSSGGLAVASALGILEHHDLARHRGTVDAEGGRPTAMAVHLVSEALRLAYADRDRYVADPDFEPLPGGSPAALLEPAYLARRAQLIHPERSMGTALAGEFPATRRGLSRVHEGGTTHYTIVDRQGNVVAMTASIESSMGSFHMTQGFLLNNQLTDFSAAPTDAAGHPIANRVEPGKRPRSSMAPTLVFRQTADGQRGEFVMATGSPGGGSIIQYVLKTLVGVLDWGLDAQQAANLIDFGAANSPTTYVGGEHPNVNPADDGVHDPLVSGLRALGHTVSVAAQSSGIGTVVRLPRDGGAVLQGGTDPRREGLALGDDGRP